MFTVTQGVCVIHIDKYILISVVDSEDKQTRLVSLVKVLKFICTYQLNKESSGPEYFILHTSVLERWIF